MHMYMTSVMISYNPLAIVHVVRRAHRNNFYNGPTRGKELRDMSLDLDKFNTVHICCTLGNILLYHTYSFMCIIHILYAMLSASRASRHTCSDGWEILHTRRLRLINECWPSNTNKMHVPLNNTQASNTRCGIVNAQTSDTQEPVTHKNQ